jgi:glycine/D-amino acid oxidase-like deaminating enzyme
MVDSDTAAHCLRCLRAATRPLPAAELARLLFLTGNRESQRRMVRAIIKHLRDLGGVRIVAANPAGYWITDDDQVWRDYIAGRAIDAKTILKEAGQRTRVLADQGQQLLFAIPT